MEGDEVTEAIGSSPSKASDAAKADSPSEPEKRSTSRVVDAMATSAKDSMPLVPLAPAQARSGIRAADKALRPSSQGVQKVKGTPRQSTAQNQVPSPGFAAPGNQKLREQRKSAPDHGRRASNELRGSKSAPDLSAHALAAIRSIQAGTLQLDNHLRTKIAAAAKRVLQAREMKRRSSGGNVTNQGELAENTIGQLGSNLSPVPTTVLSSSQAFASPTQQLGNGASPASLSRLSTPQSLATAAAIARGESLLLSHSPPASVLEPASQPSSGAFTAAHPPFTVTTGVPKFAQGKGASNAAMSGLHSLPLSSRQPLPDLQLPRKPSASLSIGDLPVRTEV